LMSIKHLGRVPLASEKRWGALDRGPGAGDGTTAFVAGAIVLTGIVLKYNAQSIRAAWIIGIYIDSPRGASGLLCDSVQIAGKSCLLSLVKCVQRSRMSKTDHGNRSASGACSRSIVECFEQYMKNNSCGPAKQQSAVHCRHRSKQPPALNRDNVPV